MNKIIYSLKIMLQLVEMGNLPVSTMENPKYSEYKCWVFEMTDKLQHDLDIVLGGPKDGKR